MRIIVMGDTQTRDVCFPAFVTCFNRIWPDDLKHFPLTFVFSKGGPSEWTRALSFALADSGDYVLLLLSDYLLVHVDEDLLRLSMKAISYMGVEFVRLLPCPGPALPYGRRGGDLGCFSSDQPYLLSLQATIWKPGFLRSLLRVDETVWDTEHVGTSRAQAYLATHPDSIYLGTQRNALSYQNLYRRGQRQEDVWRWYQESLSDE